MTNQLPLVYSSHYDITLLGLEKLHPFDSAKYGKVYRFLRKEAGLKKTDFHRPEAVSREELLEVHTAAYLDSLKQSAKIAQIAELGLLSKVPAFLLDWRLLRPMRFATGGTLLAADLAMEHGWAINLGGGYHHAKADSSSGFCFYADINLAALRLTQKHKCKKVMVIDLDAHQGNGFEAIFAGDPRFVTLDVYNGDIYPHDSAARKFINYDFPIPSHTGDDFYNDVIRWEIPAALEKEQPDCIIYNAGTDIFEKDPLGALSITGPAIMKRDLFVFRQAWERKIPILMLLSGGYHALSWQIIGHSIKNVMQKLEFGGK